MNSAAPYFGMKQVLVHAGAVTFVGPFIAALLEFLYLFLPMAAFSSFSADFWTFLREVGSLFLLNVLNVYWFGFPIAVGAGILIFVSAFCLKVNLKIASGCALIASLAYLLVMRPSGFGFLEFAFVAGLSAAAGALCWLLTKCVMR